MNARHYGWLMLVFGVLLCFATFAFGLASVWAVDPELGNRFSGSAWACGFFGVILVGVGGCVIDCNPKGRR